LPVMNAIAALLMLLLLNQPAFSQEAPSPLRVRSEFHPIMQCGDRYDPLRMIRNDLTKRMSPGLFNDSALGIVRNNLSIDNRDCKPLPPRRSSAQILAETNQNYFPSGLGKYRQSWYTRHLIAMDEKSLQALANSEVQFVCRLLWLRSFHHSICIRVTKYDDGKAILVAKELSGSGGFDSGKLTKNTEVNWTELQFRQFEQILDKVKIYDQKSMDESTLGYDGAEWVYEINDGGRYHVVDRSSCHNTMGDLGTYLIKSAGLMPPTKSQFY